MPPKTAKVGGQRYSKKIKKWAKIDLLRFTQYHYHNSGPLPLFSKMVAAAMLKIDNQL
jgi:hypothetical protein